MYLKLRCLDLLSWQVIKGFDKFEIRAISPSDRNQCQGCDQKTISLKQRCHNIYSSSLISIGFNKFHSMARVPGYMELSTSLFLIHTPHPLSLQCPIYPFELLRYTVQLM